MTLFSGSCNPTLKISAEEKTDLYDILGVGKNACDQQIRDAYKKSALTYHPDKNLGNEEALDNCKRVIFAYSVLSDPCKRYQYDLTRQDTDGRKFNGYDMQEFNGLIIDNVVASRSKPETVKSEILLSSKVIDFLQIEPMEEDDPLLFISYQEPFMLMGNVANNKAAVENILVNAGGVKIDDDVFKFVDWPMMSAARDQMSAAMPWLFYDPAGTTAYLHNGQWIPHQTLQTIHTTALTWYSEQTKKHEIVAYEFFSR